MGNTSDPSNHLTQFDINEVVIEEDVLNTAEPIIIDLADDSCDDAIRDMKLEDVDQEVIVIDSDSCDDIIRNMKFDIDDIKQEKSVEEITIPDDMKMMYDDIKLEEAFRTQEESLPSHAKRARFDEVNLPSGPNPLNPGYINPMGTHGYGPHPYAFQPNIGMGYNPYNQGFGLHVPMYQMMGNINYGLNHGVDQRDERNHRGRELKPTSARENRSSAKPRVNSQIKTELRRSRISTKAVKNRNIKMEPEQGQRITSIHIKTEVEPNSGFIIPPTKTFNPPKGQQTTKLRKPIKIESRLLGRASSASNFVAVEDEDVHLPPMTQSLMGGASGKNIPPIKQQVN